MKESEKKLGCALIFSLALILAACGNGSDKISSNGLAANSAFESQASYATAVNTLLKATPPSCTDSTTANFKFKCNQASCSFKCNRDSEGWSSCKSPKIYSSLPDGPHTFKVKARDLATGVWDSSYAKDTWTVNTAHDAGTYSLTGKWLLDPNQMSAKDNIGMQFDSGNNLVDTIGLFSVLHPAAGTALVCNTGQFTVQAILLSHDTLDPDPPMVLEVNGQLSDTNDSGTCKLDLTVEGKNRGAYGKMVLQPATSPLQGAWTGTIHDSKGQDHALSVTLDSAGAVTACTGWGTFAGGNSVSDADGGRAVIFIYSEANAELKMSSAISGNTFSGSCSYDGGNDSLFVPKTFSIAK